MTRRYTRPRGPKPCKCHLPALGHHYDGNLRCECGTNWYAQQARRTVCPVQKAKDEAKAAKAAEAALVDTTTV